MSYLTYLSCSGCGRIYSASEIHTYCKECESPLLALYDLNAAKSKLMRDNFKYLPKGLWRWKDLLPVNNDCNIISLGEGDTPLLELSNLNEHVGINRLFLKDESLNPTGSFKSRGLSVAVSKAKELGIKKLIIPSAGNAGGALAAYAARSGIQACIFMPKDTPRANIIECEIAGAEVHLVNGFINDAGKIAQAKANLEGWFDVSTFKEPYRCEGKKTMGYELAESLNWILPDVIVYPTGGGTGFIGIWKAFNELAELGWLHSAFQTRFVVVQTEGCAPIVRAFKLHANMSTPWENARTIASGLRVPKSFADRLILQILYDKNGTAIAVSDDEIIESQKLLGRYEGIFAAPEGAATVAGLSKLVKQKWIQTQDTVVIINTGTGLKYL